MKSFQYRVYYEDTDAGGIVYYGNYLKFLERARTDLLLQSNISQIDLWKSGIFFVVQQCNIEYIASAFLEDTLSVSCKVLKMGRASILFEQSVMRDGQELAKATVKIVCVTKNNNIFKTTPIPTAVHAILKKIS